MNKEKVYLDLLEIVDKSQILQDEPMKNHTTFKIGGSVDFMVIATNISDIINTYNYANNNNIPFYIIGNASNLLVKDNGIRGIVVKNNCEGIQVLKEEGDFVEIEALSGTTLAKLSNYALDKSLIGLEFSFGIPATVGGAVRMNAGAYGGEMKDCVFESMVLDKDGNQKVISFEEHNFTYRNSEIANKKYIVLSSKFRLKKGNKDEIKEKMFSYMDARLEKQPYNMPSAGSVFKRGNGFITAAIIDEAGLKGKRIGGAMVSEKHAGFIVNAGNATAQDVIELIDYVKKDIKEKFDKELITEIIIVGE